MSDSLGQDRLSLQQAKVAPPSPFGGPVLAEPSEASLFGQSSVPLVSSAHSVSDGHGVTSITSVPNAVFLLCCMSLGVGVFAMPTVLNSVGWPMGMALIVFFGVISTLIMLLVLTLADERGCQDPDQFAALVPGCRALSTLGMCVSPLIANAAHLQLVSGMLFDMMEWFITSDFGEYRFRPTQKLVLLVIFIGIALPWCFMNSLGALRHVGNVVAGTIISTSAVVVGSSLLRVSQGRGATGDDATSVGPVTLESFMIAAPTVCFAYSGMFQLFEVFGAMQRGFPNGAVPHMRRAVVYAGVLVTVLYLTVASACIWAFGKKAGVTHKGNGLGNALYNFPPDNYPVTVLCIGLVVAIILDYPIINMPLVNTILRLNFHCTSWQYARHALSVFFAVVVITVDMVVPDLSDVFGLCGALGMSNFCYIVPGAVLLCKSQVLLTRVVGGISILIGLAMLFGSTTLIVKGIIDKQ